jgi:hypothetical protein
LKAQRTLVLLSDSKYQAGWFPAPNRTKPGLPAEHDTAHNIRKEAFYPGA